MRTRHLPGLWLYTGFRNAQCCAWRPQINSTAKENLILIRNKGLVEKETLQLLKLGSCEWGLARSSSLVTCGETSKREKKTVGFHLSLFIYTAKVKTGGRGALNVAGTVISHYLPLFSDPTLIHLEAPPEVGRMHCKTGSSNKSLLTCATPLIHQCLWIHRPGERTNTG